MIRKLTKDEYVISNWSGGKTIQIAIGPEGAVYADRDFLWRVSSATVELPESDYTSLPDYDRFITPLNGQMILTHNGGEAIDVEPFEVHEFDGADSTHCVGVCTDFNLMLRKGKAAGDMFVLEPDLENSILMNPLTASQIIVLYVVTGTASIMLPDDTCIEVGEGEAAVLTDEPAECLLETDSSAVALAAMIELL